MAWKYRFVIAACARWESPYAAEWLTYHRAVGFEHVYLYCNDDDPAELYEAILPFTQGPDPFVTFRYFPEQGMQRQMLMHFCAHDGRDSEWVSFLDLDEFLRLPPGQTLPDYMRAFEDQTDCLMFNWVYFGPNGHKTHPGTRVLATYTRREAHLHPNTKYLARSHLLLSPDLFVNCTDNAFVHQLAGFISHPIRAMNVLAEDMADYYEAFPDRAAAFVHDPSRSARIFDAALIHHYAFRSEKAFEDRVARGLKGNYAAEKMWGDVAADPVGFANLLTQLNAVEDTSLSRFWDGLIARAWESTVGPGSAVGFVVVEHDPALIDSILAGMDKVVLVQPDARLYYALAARFAAEIAEGRLVLENFAPAPRGGEIAMLAPSDGGRPYPVATISWDELVAKHGRPVRVHMAAEIPGFPAPVE